MTNPKYLELAGSPSNLFFPLPLPPSTDPRHAVLIHPLAEQPGSRFQFANGRREIRLLPSPIFCKQSGHETEQRTDPNNEACIYTRASIPRIQTRVHSCAQQERMEDSGELSHFSPSRGRTRDPRGGEREREREKKNENLRLVRGKKSSNQEPSLPSAGERVQRIAVQKRRTTPPSNNTFRRRNV